MKDDAGKKGTGRAMPALLGLVGTILIGIVIYLYRGEDQAEKDLARAKREYQEMRDWKVKIAQIQGRAPQGQRGSRPPAEKVDDALDFLAKKAGEAGIDRMIVPVSAQPEKTTGEWRELPFDANFTIPRDKPIPRGALVTFLEKVETERPYLKSKNLLVKFADNDVSEARVTISFFKSGR